MTSLKYLISTVVFMLQVCIITPLLWFTFTAYRDADLKQLQTREDTFLALSTQIARKALLVEDAADFQLFITSFATAYHIKQIMLTDQSGIVVASTEPTNIGLPMPRLQQEKKSVWKSTDISNAAEQLGTIAIHYSRAEMDKSLQALVGRGIPIALAAVIISALVGLGLGHLLTRRLQDLERASRRMGDGEMGVTVRIGGIDEVGRLARVFNEMSRNLQIQFNELQQTQQELAFQAQHDPLTGLPNRLLFDLRCSQAIASAHHNHHSAALLFFDLDHFKNINDSYGHQVGDCVLRAVAARLTLTLQNRHLIARLGEIGRAHV